MLDVRWNIIERCKDHVPGRRRSRQQRRRVHSAWTGTAGGWWMAKSCWWLISVWSGDGLLLIPGVCFWSGEFWLDSVWNNPTVLTIRSFTFFQSRAASSVQSSRVKDWVFAIWMVDARAPMMQYSRLRCVQTMRFLDMERKNKVRISLFHEDTASLNTRWLASPSQIHCSASSPSSSLANKAKRNAMEQHRVHMLLAIRDSSKPNL